MNVKFCSECKRGPMFFEGCSHSVCPQRKPVTAQPVGSRFLVNSQVEKGNLVPSNSDGIRAFTPKET